MGHLVVELGGGRQRKTDVIDHSVGVELLKTVGDAVTTGENWAAIHHLRGTKLEPNFVDRLQLALKISTSELKRQKRVWEIVGDGH